MKRIVVFYFIFLIQGLVYGQKWIDLTHPFDSTTLYWPNNKLTFSHNKDFKGYVKPMGYFYSSYSISAPEHGGTHLDAPIHFADGRQSVDQIPLENLVGNAVVIDVSERALQNRDYLISIDDWKSWEKRNGRVPEGSIVLFKTGYSQFYPNREKYFGTAQLGQEAIPQLRFPGISSELAKWVVKERSIKSFGIDTPSMDYGQSTDFQVHQIFLGENIPGFENVNLSMDLPSKGLYVVAMPMKISQGSGAPLRIMASIQKMKVFFNTTLETPLMILRGFDQQSYDELFSSAHDSEISEVLGISTAEELELEKFRYKGGYSTYNLTIQFFQLVAKEDNRVLGWCGYHSWAKQHRRAEIFYMLKSDDDKRKGLMSEALGKVLEYGKTEMNLRRIEAFVATDNPASYRLVEKFGFQKEAELKFRYQFGDEVDWDFMYALILE